MWMQRLVAEVVQFLREGGYEVDQSGVAVVQVRAWQLFEIRINHGLMFEIGFGLRIIEFHLVGDHYQSRNRRHMDMRINQARNQVLYSAFNHNRSRWFRGLERSVD